METKDVLKRQEKLFNRIRKMVTVLIILLVLAIVALQFNNIQSFFKWIFNNN
jgi:hypothetical protein